MNSTNVMVSSPLAFVKRPVPPTMVADKVTWDSLGGMKLVSTPSVSVRRTSPLAAVKSTVPVAVLLLISTLCRDSAVKRPRCVALPTYVAMMRSQSEGTSEGS